MPGKDLLNQVNTWKINSVDSIEIDEINTLVENENFDELQDCFSSSLDFGTAGLRGILGPGPNRMNLSVVAHTSYGLAQVLKAAGRNSIVIGFDGRKRSDEFARLCAGIMLTQGLKVFMYETVAATPLVAYALLKLKADAAVVVTASHNPPAYNGYKVYWQNGAQIISPVDAAIKKEKESAPAAKSIEYVNAGQLSSHGSFQYIDYLRSDYIRDASAITRPVSEKIAGSIRIAYTPLHGVGAETLETLFKANGFIHLFTVKEQREPDPLFSTVGFPNPEEPGALDLLLDLARTENCDIAIATGFRRRLLPVITLIRFSMATRSGASWGITCYPWQKTKKAASWFLRSSLHQCCQKLQKAGEPGMQVASRVSNGLPIPP